MLFGTVAFTMFGGFYFWWPKWTGRKLNETLGKWYLWSVFIGWRVRVVRRSARQKPAVRSRPRPRMSGTARAAAGRTGRLPAAGDLA